MTGKIERVFRDRRLSAGEIASDNDVCRKALAEFPLATILGNASGRVSESPEVERRNSEKSMPPNA